MCWSALSGDTESLIEMKILVYEPHSGGHHLTILNYIETRISLMGHDIFIHRTQLSRENEYAALQELASEENCDLIYSLTIDGSGRRWMLSSARRGKRRIPHICNYYLYSNLSHPIKKWMWWILLRRGLVQRILISDENMGGGSFPGLIERSVRYLPDPWDPEVFPPFPKNEARLALAIPSGRTCILLFGEISSRKGADLLVEAFARVADQDRHLLLLVGRVGDDLRIGRFQNFLNAGIVNKTIRLIEGYVAEEDVTKYFHACDLVACTYPSWFRVSSGTFTRACAAMRPAIAPRGGAVGECMQRHGIGFCYKASSFDSLVSVLAKALSEAVYQSESGEFKNACRKISDARALKRYGAALESVISEFN